VHGLKSVVHKYLLQDEKRIFEIHLMSFGFKYGIPLEADVVLDVRFLTNPYFDAQLKNKTGQNFLFQVFAYFYFSECVPRALLCGKRGPS